MKTTVNRGSRRGIDEVGSGKFRLRLRSKHMGTFNTLEEAIRFRDEHEGVRSTVLVGTWVEAWLERRERQGKRAFKSELSLVRCHVLSHPIAKMQLVRVKPWDISDWLNDLSVKKAQRRSKGSLKGRTLRNVLRLLSAAFKSAMPRHLKENPCDNQELPVPIEKDTWDYFSVPEQTAMLESSAPEPLRILVAFAIGTGIRQREQMSIKVEDVVLTGDDPHVMIARGARDNRLPKNGKKRKVVLFGMGLRAARAWVAWRALIQRDSDSPWFFAMPERYFRRTYKSELGGLGIVMAAAGIAPRPYLSWHSLRHTCASTLIAGAWSDDAKPWTLNEVKVLLGHGSISVTERYAHLAESAIRKRADLTSGTPHLQLSRSDLTRLEAAAGISWEDPDLTNSARSAA